jgi:CubicO group peptidase (beta-lactamase class C family)
MTVRDLMRHTAGLTYGIFAQSEVDTLVLQANVLDRQITLEEMVARLGELPLKTQPGSTFEYSLASDVLGRVIEVASEMPLDRLFQERIFAPLGMVDTGFYVPTEKLDRVADVYRRQGQELARVEGNGASGPDVKPLLFSGGGGLFSTADDYMIFCRLLVNEGELAGTRLLKPETVALMASDQLTDIGGSRMVLGGGTFGLSVAVVTQSAEVGPAAGSFWWGGMAGTGFWIDPETDVIGVFMIQNMMELNHTMAFQSDVYRALR